MTLAFFRGNLELVQLLVDKGAELQSSGAIYTPSQIAVSPLYLAISSGCREIVEFVLENSIDLIDQEGPNGNSPVHEAIELGLQDILFSLVEHGADVTKPDRNGLLPIGLAIGPNRRFLDQHSLNMCQTLSRRTPVAQQFVHDQRFQYYWPWMASFQPATMEYLKQQSWGNTYNSIGSHFGQFWAELCHGSPETCLNVIHDIDLGNVKATKFEESHVLLYAVYKGWNGVVEHLLQAADYLQCSIALKSRALCEAIQSYHHELVDVLLDAKADLNSNSLRTSPLSLAILSTSMTLVEHLLEKGANPMSPCSTFGNSIRAAHEYAQPDACAKAALRLLINNGGDPNLVINEDETILVAMAAVSSEESLLTIRTLLGAGADCNATSRSLITASMAAAASSGHCSVHILGLLHDHGADLNAFRGMYGSALLAAATSQAYESAEKIRRLIEWGADPRLPGPHGTFFEFAAIHPDVCIRNLALNSPDISEELKKSLRCQALLQASVSGTLATMLELIEEGVDVNGQGEFFGSTATPLIAASYSPTRDKSEKIELLLAHGADVNYSSLGYFDVLQLYLDNNNQPSLEIVQHLIDRGIDVNARSGPGLNGTAMEIAFD